MDLGFTNCTERLLLLNIHHDLNYVATFVFLNSSSYGLSMLLLMACLLVTVRSLKDIFIIKIINVFFSFFMGLNEAFSSVRHHLMLWTLLSPLNQCYNMLVQEASSRGINGYMMANLLLVVLL